MNVLFLSLSDVKSSLYGSLAKEFVTNGHSVTIISPSVDGFSDETIDNIRSLKFKSISISGGNILKKGIANLFLPWKSTRIVRKYIECEKIDLIISSTPPLSFYRPIEYIKRRNSKAKHYLILRDIWPEAFNLFDYQKKYPLIYSVFRVHEKKLYASANIIGCMSEGNIEFVMNSNPETYKKLRLLPNWGKLKHYEKVDISIKDKYGLKDKFILIYGGNMSVPQGLDNIVRLAEMIKDKKDVVILLIGKGTEKNRIKELVDSRHLSNIKIMDYMPSEDYEAILRVCDVGLISLNDRLKTPSIPSKTISYWNLKLPILAITDHVTDYGYNIIDKTESGLWSYVGDDEKLLNNFNCLYLSESTRKQMGENGYSYMIKECSVEKTYYEIIAQLYE